MTVLLDRPVAVLDELLQQRPCPEDVQPVWPCPAWRAAHRWMVELDPITGNRYEDEWFLMPQP